MATNAFYQPHQRRLVYVENRATPSFWDAMWQTNDLRQRIEKTARDPLVTSTTQRFLAPARTTRILEAGCGQGGYVLSLKRAGYSAHGIDFAEKTIHAAQAVFPELQLTVGDVRSLPYPDQFFDGYWSLGVIEHFFDGYQAILQEMNRVLKPGGYAFITFPTFNRLRQLKATLGLYPHLTDTAPADFYQFALNRHQVIRDFIQAGFKLRAWRGLDGLKGLKDDIPTLRPLLYNLKHSRSRALQKCAGAIGVLAAPLAGHVTLCIMQKHDHGRENN